MNRQLLSDGCVESLRDDLPTPAEQRRMAARLSAAGVAVSAALVSQSAAAAGAGLWSSMAAKFTNLPLLAQLALVTTGTAALATPPVVFYEGKRTSRRAEPQQVALPVANRPVVNAEATSALLAQSKTPVESSASATPNPIASELATSARRVVVSESSLSEETRLLDAALASIRGKELGRAQQLIEQHASRYPEGRLAAERERARAKLTQALAASTSGER